MVTGASTADLSIVLVDARKGVIEQTRRHAFIASLLRIPHLVVAVNKMDLVDYDEDVFDEIVDELTDWAARLQISPTSPSSRSPRCTATTSSSARDEMPWYDGPPLLYHLEHVVIAPDRNLADVRFPVQWVIRPMSRRAPRLPRLRRPGRRRRAAPRRRGRRAAERPATTISAIDTYDGELDAAFPPMSVTLRLDDELDVSRGDMIVERRRPARWSRASSTRWSAG